MADKSADELNNFIKQTDLGDLWTLYRQPTNGSLLYTAELHDPMPHIDATSVRKGDVVVHASDAYSGPAEIRIVERGPLRAKLEIRYPEARLITSVSNGTYIRPDLDDSATAHRGRFALPISNLRMKVGQGVPPSRDLKSAPFTSVSLTQNEKMECVETLQREHNFARIVPPWRKMPALVI